MIVRTSYFSKRKGTLSMPSGRRGSQGQVLVLVAGGFFALVALVALVVDGGNLFAQQRVVQNGADASAEAGAVVMAEKLAGATAPGGGWDDRVQTRVAAAAAANGATVQAAYYTDICGIPLTPAGTAALNLDGTENLGAAAQVGSGFPASATVTPDCPSLTVGPPAGVLVLATKNVGTYFAAAIGLADVDVSQRATAVAGYLQGVCDASLGNACALLPVAIPVNAVTCAGNNDPINSGIPWSRHTVYKVPLCNGAPGNVGWLDWDPPNGGASELVCSIVTPDNPPINLPSWQYVAQAGNTNGGGGPCGASVESAIRNYNGQIVLIPQFDVMCGDDPNHAQVATGPNYGCPPDELDGGNGSNLWYRMPSFAYFELCDPALPDCTGLQGAYIQGSDAAVCDTGNGATSCLVGKFVDILGSGTVGAGVGGGSGSSKTLGVQLIK